MYESIYVTLWVLATAMLLFHAGLKRGGVISSGFMLLMYYGLYYVSTNVLVETSAGLISTNNTIAGWLAVYGTIASFIIFVFCLFGLWGTTREEQTRDSDDVGVGVSDDPRTINSIMKRI